MFLYRKKEKGKWLLFVSSVFLNFRKTKFIYSKVIPMMLCYQYMELTHTHIKKNQLRLVAEYEKLMML